MTRFFVALKLPGSVRDEITSLRKQAYSGKEFFRWEKSDKLHLTLRFIGEIEDDRVESIQKELKFMEEYSVFECNFTKFGFFFNHGVPKILWMGLHTSEKIFTLANELNFRLEKFSIPVEKRKFKSHITLLRLKGNPGENFINGFENFNVPQKLFTCDSIALMKSDLRPGGSVYTEIKNYKLKDMEE